MIPRRYQRDDCHVIGLWHHDEDSRGPADAMPSPWNTCLSHARTGAGTPVLSLPELPRPEFTAECWFCCPRGRPRGRVRETILECVADEAPAWSLTLNENLCLEFAWQDRRGASAMCKSRPLPELMLHAGWHHLAVSFQNPCGWFEDDRSAKLNALSKESCVRLYCTPIGAAYPRTVGALAGFVRPHVRTEPGVVTAGDGNGERWGVLAEVAVSNIAKLENQFSALCPPLPATLKPNADIECGSGRDWMINELGELEFCGGSDGQENTFWFHFRLDGEPGKITFCFNPSGKREMANAAYLSYDRKQWTRIRDARFASTAPRRLLEPRSRGTVPHGMPLTEGVNGQLRFSVELTQTPAYLAGGIPYLAQHVQALETELAKWAMFKPFTIGYSGHNRPIKGWRITDPTVPDDRKQRILLTNGQHSPYEIQVGWGVDAMVREIARSTTLQKALKRLSLAIVPIVNMDAAAEGGNTSLSRNGVNLNRDWFALREPETAAVAAFIDKRLGGKVDLCLDLHGSGPCGSHFLMGTVPEALSPISPTLATRQRRAQDLLCRHLGIQPDDNRLRTLTRKNESIWGNGLDRPNLVNRVHSLYAAPAFTVEISPCVQSIDPPGVLEPISQRAYATLGKALLNACLEWAG